MWLFTSIGFFSVVAHRDKKKTVMVRARCRQDLLAFRKKYCKKLKPIVHELATDYEGRIKVVEVDVDRARESAARFRVMSVPTVLLIDSGTVKDQIVGLLSKKALAERVDRVL